MRTVLLASLRTHTRRYVAAALAVTIGVAFVVITAGLTAAARDGLTAGVSAPYAGADVVASGDVQGTSADRLVRGAAASGAEAAVLGWAVLEVRHDGRALDDSGDVGHVTTTPDLRWQVLEDGAFPTGPGEAVVDVGTAESARIAVGDRLQVGSGAQATDVRVVGLVDSPSALVQADVYLTWDDLAVFADQLYVESVAWAGSGTADDQAGAITALVDTATVQPSDDYVQDLLVEVNQGVDALALVLLLFASIALVVSVIVIANTFSILFAQRQRDFALLRCVGATRQQVLGSVRIEALVLGLVSSVVGLVAGTGLAVALVAAVGAWFPSAGLGAATVSPAWYAAALAVGLLVTLVASWLPTRRVTTVSPLTALRPDATVDTGTTAGRVRVALGLVAILAGVGLLALAVTGRDPVVMVAGGTTTFTGVLLLGPVLVPGLIRLVGLLTGRALGTPGRLAVGNAVRHPRRTAATTASLLVGVTLTTAVLTGMASARGAVDAELDLQHPLDATVTATRGDLPGGLVAAAGRLDGVTAAEPVPGTTAQVEGLGRVDLLGPDPSPGLLHGEGASVTPGPDQLVLPTGLLGETSHAEGSAVDVVVGDRTERLRIVAGEGWGDAAALVAPETLAALTDSPGNRAVWLRVDPGTDPEALDADLGALPGGAAAGAEVAGGFADRAYVDLQLDVVTAAVVGLLGVAVVIALIGIGNTLGLSVLERGREHALLRALGLTRRQLRATLALEAVLLAVVATLVGTVLGVAFAWVGVEAMVRDVVDSAPMVLPLGQLTLVVLTAGVAGLLACVLPARRAARTAPAAGLAAE